MEKLKLVSKVTKKSILLVLIFALTLVLDVILSFFLTTNNYYLNNIMYKISTWMMYFIFPFLACLLFLKNNKYIKKLYVTVGIYIAVTFIVFGTSIAYEKYSENLRIKTDVNIDVNEYLPFTINSKIVKLRTYSFIKA